MLNNANLYKIKKVKKKFSINKKKYNKVYEHFAKIVILVVFVLSFILLFLAIGDLISYASKNIVANAFSNIFIQIAKISLENLAILFSLITVGIFTNSCKALIASFIGFLIFLAVQYSFIHFGKTNDGGYYIKDIMYFYYDWVFILGNNIGIPSINISFFGGMIIGLLNSYIYNKFKDIRLPKSIGFLNGFPLISILIILVNIFLAVMFLLLWIGIGYLLKMLYFWLKTSDSNNFAAQGFVYSIVNTILTPLGFKSNFNNLFSQVNDDLLSNEEFYKLFRIIASLYDWKYSSVLDKWNNHDIQNIWDFLHSNSSKNQHLSLLEWMNLLPANLPSKEGNSLPIYDWFLKQNRGPVSLKLPPNYSISLGACVGIMLAVILTSKKENRSVTITITLLIVLITFITGNTIAIDLLIFFISPMLFFMVYLPINGLNGLFMSLFNVHITSATSEGLISLIFNGIIPSAKGTNYHWIFLFSFIWGAILFIVFYKYTKFRDLPFIGRRETVLPRITWKDYHNIWNH